MCLISSGLLCYPLDTVRRQMMMQAGKLEKTFQSSLSCWYHIAKYVGAFVLPSIYAHQTDFQRFFRTSGPRGFYRGAMTNSLRSTGGAMIITCYYEFAKYLWTLKSSMIRACVPISKLFFFFALFNNHQLNASDTRIVDYWAEENWAFRMNASWNNALNLLGMVTLENCQWSSHVSYHYHL